ncbi:MAG: hypothetical protein WCV82_04345 [Candidatus Paceibacterota bacterium]
MVISRQDQTLSLKDGTQTVKCSDRLEIGEFSAPGPGEYDVAGISAIVLPGLSSLATVVSDGGLSILYLDRPVTLNKESDDLANIDVLVTRVNSASELKDAQKVAKDLEPSGWALFGTLTHDEIAKELTLNGDSQEKWTVTASSLPEEGMEIIDLA